MYKKISDYGIIGKYLYDEDDRNYLMNNAENIKVDFQDYDWRLNRE